MNRRWTVKLVVPCSALGLLAVLALSIPAKAVSPSPRAVKEARNDVQLVTAKINQHIADKWKENEVTPSARTTDAEFLRRVYLDIVGRIPNIVEVSDFKDDPSPNKRAEIVDKLLNPAAGDTALKDLYVNNFANFWRAGLMPETNDPNQRFGGNSFENWIRTRVRNNVGYDKMVRELMTFNGRGGAGDQGLQAFYQANEFKAENLAASTSRFFLGNKLECAQCHNHPFSKVSREQFWEYAAFFIGVNQQFNGGKGREITIPGTDPVKKVTAKFLDGSEPQWKDSDDPRVLLADWMVSPENPYFARTAVNRLWAYFFGLGIHDPVDEPWSGKATHPELLEELAKDFATHGFDVKFMIKAIVASDAYQLSSKGNHASQDDPRWFGKMLVRGMTPEQLFDSLAEATGFQPTPGGIGRDMFGQPINARSEFIAKFASIDKKTETQTSILQALYLMNGKFIQDSVSLKSNKVLNVIADSNHKKGTAGKIGELYKITLSRMPTEKELERLVKYVDDGGANKDDSKKALADIFWVLLNSSEFALNH